MRASVLVPIRFPSISTPFKGAGRLPVAMSMFASVTSAVTFMGLPAIAYGGNVAILTACLISPLVVPLLVLVPEPVHTLPHTGMALVLHTAEDTLTSLPDSHMASIHHLGTGLS